MENSDDNAETTQEVANLEDKEKAKKKKKEKKKEKEKEKKESDKKEIGGGKKKNKVIGFIKFLNF